MSESIVRRGLFDLARLGVFDTFKILSRTKGRPFWNYSTKNAQQIAKKLGVKLHRDENADAIPFDAFESGKTFRAAKHYSLIARLGKSRLSRRKLGARLGVGGRSTFNYEEDTNIEVKQRIERTQLSMADVANAPQKRLNANIFLEVEIVRELTPMEIIEEHGIEGLENPFIARKIVLKTIRMPYNQFVLRRELERGNDVFLCKQITNEYSIKS